MGWIPLSLAANAIKDIGATLTLHILKYYTFNRVKISCNSNLVRWLHNQGRLMKQSHSMWTIDGWQKDISELVIGKTCVQTSKTVPQNIPDQFKNSNKKMWFPLTQILSSSHTRTLKSSGSRKISTNDSRLPPFYAANVVLLVCPRSSTGLCIPVNHIITYLEQLGSGTRGSTL